MGPEASPICGGAVQVGGMTGADLLGNLGVLFGGFQCAGAKRQRDLLSRPAYSV
jgi:hypothetical protein